MGTETQFGRLALSALTTAWLALLLCLNGCGGGTSGGGDGPPPPVPSVTIKSICAFYPGGGPGPCYAIAGQSAFQLLVNGAGFTNSSLVQWNGNPLDTRFGDSSDLAASVPSSLIAAPGKATITVGSSGATSNAVEFQIASPATLTAGVVQLITIASDGTSANGDSSGVLSISTTGRFVTFRSNATNLASGPASGYYEIYERDTCLGAPSGCTSNTIRITATYDGSPVNGHSYTSTVSADGRYVAFESYATNLVPGSGVCAWGSTGGGDCSFLRDTCIAAPTGCTPTTFPLSVNAQGAITRGGGPQMSPDARFVVFTSTLSGLGLGSSTVADAFLHGTCIGAAAGCTPTTTQASLTSDGTQGNQRSGGDGASWSGRFVVFDSYATNMVPNEAAIPGVFLRDTCLGTTAGCTPTTLRADVSSTGAEPNFYETNDLFIPISADGRLVAFGSAATNLVSTNVSATCAVTTCSNVYVRDTCAGTPTGCSPSTSLASLANDGSTGNCGSPGNVGGLTLSADGRFVAFGSIATNFSPDDTFPACGWEDIFVRDTCFGVSSGCTPSTVRVSVANKPIPGTSANSSSTYSAMSADGHYVVFVSSATNFLPSAPTGGHATVWLAKTGF